MKKASDQHDVLIVSQFLCWVAVKGKTYLHPLLLDIINLIIFKNGQELSSLVNGVEKVLGQLLPLVGVVAVQFVFTKTSKEQQTQPIWRLQMSPGVPQSDMF